MFYEKAILKKYAKLTRKHPILLIFQNFKNSFFKRTPPAIHQQYTKSHKYKYMAAFTLGSIPPRFVDSCKLNFVVCFYFQKLSRGGILKN